MNEKKFREQGYLKLDFTIPESLVDAVNSELDEVWSTNQAPVGISNQEYQQKWLDDGNRRLQEAWTISGNIHKVAVYPAILDVLRELFGREPRPFQTLNFELGSEQDVHSDAVHFNCEPFGMMSGVWLAMEDIGPAQGALCYYPGSQKMPEATADVLGFDISPANYPHIVEYWKTAIVENHYPEEQGILKKGEGIIWDANLLHGGAPHHDKSMTRKSMVTHYYFEGCKPWRPLHSSDGKREYFEPEWIPTSVA